MKYGDRCIIMHNSNKFPYMRVQEGWKGREIILGDIYRDQSCHFQFVGEPPPESRGRVFGPSIGLPPGEWFSAALDMLEDAQVPW